MLVRRKGDAVDLVLDNLRDLSDVMERVAWYLLHADMDDADKLRVGEVLLREVQETGMRHSHYQNMCMLNLYSRDADFNHRDDLMQLWSNMPGDADVLRREIILALGRAGAYAWFQTRRRDWDSWEPWLRRAFLAAYSCVPSETGAHFYKSVKSTGDVLDRAVVAWAEKNPFA